MCTWLDKFAIAQDRVRINGSMDQRLPNTLSISIRGLDSSAALAHLADKLVRCVCSAAMRSAAKAIITCAGVGA